MANYFTCTLGEATALPAGFVGQYATVNELLARKALETPAAFAVGLPGGGGRSVTYSRFL